jgi:CRISPR-associated protein Csd1
VLLRDLHDLYGRLVDEREVLPEGFRASRVKLVVDLSRDGEVRTVQAPTDERGRPLERVVPDLPRAYGIDPLPISDKLSYVLGIGLPAKRARSEAQHLAYRTLLEELMGTSSAPLADRVEAVWTATGEPASLAEALRASNVPLDPRGWLLFTDELSAADAKVLDEQAQWFVDFTVDGEAFFPSLIGDNLGDPDCVAWWSHRAASHSTSDRTGWCQVTDQRAPLARLFPGVGELPGNAPRLVSCNFDAAERYGASQSDGASVSTTVATRSTQALKWLAGKRRAIHRWDLGELVLVWWCPDDLGFDPLAAHRADPAKVRDLLSKKLWSGNPNLHVRSKFHLAALTVNSARIVVRADHTMELAQAQQRLDSWFDALQPVWDHVPNARLGIPELAAAACGPGRNQAPKRARAALDLARAALLGQQLPLSLRNQVVRRCAVGTVDNRGRRVHVTNAQAGLLHLFLDQEKENPMPESPGALCGRLFAILEYTQQRALGWDLNRGVQDSYPAASTTPRAVFGRLLKRRIAHIRRLQRDKGRGPVVFLDQQMERVMQQLGPEGAPRMLSPSEQFDFALGYWHQRHEMRLPRPGTAGNGDETADHDDQDLEALSE